MRSVLLLLALAAASVHAQPRVEPLPVTYLPGGAASEGCRRQWQTASQVTAFSAPTEASRALRTIDGLRRVDANDYTESLTAVLQPGRVRATRAATMQAVRMDRGQTTTLSLAAGQELTWLGSAGEESVYVVSGDVVYAGALPAGVERVAPPVGEVWVRLVAHGDGRPEAWLNTAQAGMVARDASCQ